MLTNHMWSHQGSVCVHLLMLEQMSVWIQFPTWPMSALNHDRWDLQVRHVQPADKLHLLVSLKDLQALNFQSIFSNHLAMCPTWKVPAVMDEGDVEQLSLLIGMGWKMACWGRPKMAAASLSHGHTQSWLLCVLTLGLESWLIDAVYFWARHSIST